MNRGLSGTSNRFALIDLGARADSFCVVQVTTVGSCEGVPQPVPLTLCILSQLHGGSPLPKK